MHIGEVKNGEAGPRKRKAGYREVGLAALNPLGLESHVRGRGYAGGRRSSGHAARAAARHTARGRGHAAVSGAVAAHVAAPKAPPGAQLSMEPRMPVW